MFVSVLLFVLTLRPFITSTLEKVPYQTVINKILWALENKIELFGQKPVLKKLGIVHHLPNTIPTVKHGGVVFH